MANIGPWRVTIEQAGMVVVLTRNEERREVSGQHLRMREQDQGCNVELTGTCIDDNTRQTFHITHADAVQLGYQGGGNHT